MTLLRSFRIRIALLTAAMAGAVLIALTAWTWRIIWDAGLGRVDDQLTRAVMPQMGFGWERRPGAWPGIERDWENNLAFGDPRHVFCQVADERGDIVYQSDDWPEGFDATAIQGKVHLLEVPAGRGGPGGRGLRGDGGRPDGPESWPGEGRPDRDGPPFPQGAGPGPGGPPDGRPGSRQPVRATFATWNGAGGVWRVGRLEAGPMTLTVGLDLAAVTQQQRDIGRALMAAACGALLLVAAGSFWIAQRALRPVAALADGAERITAQGLDQRLPAGTETAEFERLIVVFNDMLGRLEGSFRQATRFSADAAHELKTPITILQGLLDEGIKQEGLTESETQRFRKMLDEVQRLKGIIQKLLTLSLADAGRLRLEKEPVDLGAMLRETAEDIEILAPQLRVSLNIEENLIVPGDRSLLRQVFQNLVNNAIRYNVPSGKIWLQARRRKNSVEVMVSNTGAGIPEQEQNNIFKRFHRVDMSRGRESGGVGLGLSLAMELVSAHGGQIALKPEKDGVVSFAVRLPLE